MSTREIAIYDETYEAGQIAVGDQYKSVRFNSVGRMQLAIGSQGYGIIQNTPGGVTGEAINVRHHGISRHKVDGSGTPIVIGSPIMSSSGIGVVATAGNMAYGEALQPSTVSGDVIAVLMRGPFRIHA
jgi:hypothetical protein